MRQKTEFSFRSLCPQCGAEVIFLSKAAIFSTCPACRSTLHLDKQQLQLIGKSTALLENYTPFQIGSQGEYQQKKFTLIGRIQIAYEKGVWNEWYVLFDDQTTGWLSDAAGLYAITEEIKFPAALLPKKHTQIKLGAYLTFEQTDFMICDKRTIKPSALEGELPYIVDRKWRSTVIDLRHADSLMTIEYRKNLEPFVFMGKNVHLNIFNPQTLRSTHEISQDSGRLNTPIAHLECPSCGASIPRIEGITTHAVCMNCRAEYNTSTDTVSLLKEKSEIVQSLNTSLKVGDSATFPDGTYHVIGVARFSSHDEESDITYTWDEYQLFSSTQGFIWLVQDLDGWNVGKNCHSWPSVSLERNRGLAHSGLSITMIAPAMMQAMSEDDEEAYVPGYFLDNKQFVFSEQYDAVLEVALGAFTWQAQADTSHTISDYIAPYGIGTKTLSKEQYKDEISFTLSEPIRADTLAEYFHDPELTNRPNPHAQDQAAPLILMNAVAAFLSSLIVLAFLEFTWSFALVVGTHIAALYGLQHVLSFFNSRERTGTKAFILMHYAFCIILTLIIIKNNIDTSDWGNSSSSSSRSGNSGSYHK